MDGLVGPRGAVFFDEACRHCRNLARAVRPVLERRGIAVHPLQAGGVSEAVGVDAAAVCDELRMITPAGASVSGADAVVAIAREVPWARGLPVLAALPGAMPLMRYAYRRVAATRGCTPPG